MYAALLVGDMQGKNIVEAQDQPNIHEAKKPKEKSNKPNDSVIGSKADRNFEIFGPALILIPKLGLSRGSSFLLLGIVEQSPYIGFSMSDVMSTLSGCRY